MRTTGSLSLAECIERLPLTTLAHALKLSDLRTGAGTASQLGRYAIETRVACLLALPVLVFLLAVVVETLPLLTDTALVPTPGQSCFESEGCQPYLSRRAIFWRLMYSVTKHILGAG